MSVYKIALTILMCVACKPADTATQAALDGLDAVLLKDASTLFSSLTSEMSKTSFAPALRTARTQSFVQMMATVGGPLTNAPVSVGGKSFSGLATAIKRSANLASITKMNALFPKMADLLSANGVTSNAINLQDVKLYMDLSRRGLTQLTTGAKAASDDVTPAQAIKALNVAVVLAAHQLQGAHLVDEAPSEPSSEQDFALASDTSSGSSSTSTTSTSSEPTPTVCPQGDAHATSGCTKDAYPGKAGAYGIGFYISNVDDSNDSSMRWHDAFAKVNHNDSSYVVCGPGQLGANSDWGWVPNAAKPGGGESCHK